MHDLNFDQHQFSGRHKYPVEATYGPNREWTSTGLAFEDYNRAHTERHVGSHSACPPFALNAHQLRKVLLMRAFHYLHSGHTLSPDPNEKDWKEVDKAATEKALRGYPIRPDAPRIQHEMQERHRQAIRRAGSYLAFQSFVAYSSWRLGRDSVAVAADLGIEPCNVRAILERIRTAARGLGFDTGVDRRSAKRKMREANRAKRQKATTQKPITKLPKAPALCAECGQPCPLVLLGHPRKFCKKQCQQKFHTRLKRERDQAARLRFCSPECKQKFKRRWIVGGFDFSFQFSQA